MGLGSAFNNGDGLQAVADPVRQNWIDHLGVTVSLSSLPWTYCLIFLDTDPPHVYWNRRCCDCADARDFLHDNIVPSAVRLGSWSSPTCEDGLGLAVVTADLLPRFPIYRQEEGLRVETDAATLQVCLYADGLAARPPTIRGYETGDYGG